MEYVRKLHMLFLSPIEFGAFWRTSMLEEAQAKMKEKGYSFFDVVIDKVKLEEVVDMVVVKRAKKKEDVEIFIAFSSCVAFFVKEDSMVGFPLKDSFNPKNTPIKTLEDLKNACKENHLTDFAIFDGESIFEFQLKQYKQEVTTEKILEEMVKKIKSYGKLGTTNMVFNLQGNGPPFSKYDIDFDKIYKGIGEIISTNTTGHVYIKYNEQDKHAVMIEVYPKLLKHKVPFTSEHLKLMLK
jgi:hypothetical protein